MEKKVLINFDGLCHCFVLASDQLFTKGLYV